MPLLERADDVPCKDEITAFCQAAGDRRGYGFLVYSKYKFISTFPVIPGTEPEEVNCHSFTW